MAKSKLLLIFEHNLKRKLTVTNLKTKILIFQRFKGSFPDFLVYVFEPAFLRYLDAHFCFLRNSLLFYKNNTKNTKTSNGVVNFIL